MVLMIADNCSHHWAVADDSSQHVAMQMFDLCAAGIWPTQASLSSSATLASTV